MTLMKLLNLAIEFEINDLVNPYWLVLLALYREYDRNNGETVPHSSGSTTREVPSCSFLFKVTYGLYDYCTGEYVV